MLNPVLGKSIDNSGVNRDNSIAWMMRSSMSKPDVPDVRDSTVQYSPATQYLLRPSLRFSQ